MKLSDKYLLSVIEKAGARGVDDLHRKIKKLFPYVDRANVERRLKRLGKSKRIAIDKRGLIVRLKVPRVSGRAYFEPDDFYALCKKYNYPLKFKRRELKEAKGIPLEISKEEIAKKKKVPTATLR